MHVLAGKMSRKQKQRQDDESGEGDDSAVDNTPSRVVRLILWWGMLGTLQLVGHRVTSLNRYWHQVSDACTVRVRVATGAFSRRRYIDWQK